MEFVAQNPAFAADVGSPWCCYTETNTEEQRKREMAVESRDPKIKLFGKTIQLPMSSGDDDGENYKDLNNKEASSESEDNDQESQESGEKFGSTRSSTDHESPKLSAPDQENASTKDSKHEESPNETSGSQEKPPKPDKILPCPRCKSLETKFCYYNNYNVNQPRHFCKNCQRYWTAGGTMRNVPVGAGRRKKSSASHYPHITMSDAYFQMVQHNALPQRTSHLPPKSNGTILNFGSNMPLYESTASVQDITEKATKNDQCNGFQNIDQKKNLSFGAFGNADEQSSESLAAPPSSNEGTRGSQHEPKMQNPNGVPTPMPCFNGSPLPYPISPLPAFCNSGFSFPFYPATAYWGCAVPGTWSIPWPSPVIVSHPNCDASGYGLNSSNLGKHSREGDLLNNCKPKAGDDNEQSKQERRLWVPKTLRIDNPEEAAKSSIWAMLGIRNDKTDKISGEGLFKAFQRQPEMLNHNTEATQVLHANPAALSRSLSFQERL